MTSPAHDREAALIGSLLLAPEAIPTVAVMLDPGAFATPAHKRIYTAMLEIHGAGGLVDPVTVGAAVKGGGGCAAAMSAALDTVVSGSPRNALEYAREVAAERERVELSGSLDVAAHAIQDASLAELPVLVEYARRSVARAQGALGGASSAVRLRDMAAAEVLDVVNGTAEGLVTPTGMLGFDAKFGGLLNTFNVVAGHPGMGKSTYLINLALNAALDKKRVIIMSMEDSRGVIVDRMIARLAGLPAFSVVQRKLDDDQRARVIPMEARLKALDILIDDKAGRSSADLRADLMRHYDAHGADLVLVDHLGKIRDPGKSLYERASAASGALADIQKELGCPLIAAHQMSRRDKGAAVRLPAIDDLRDSGWIEADARMIIMLHREHYYWALAKGSDEEPDPSAITVIVGKNTSGPTGLVPLYCDMAQSFIGDFPAKEWD